MPSWVSHIRTLSALCWLAALSPVLTGCGTEDGNAGPSEEPGIAVVTARVEQAVMEEVVQAVGSLEAWKRVEIRPEVDGIVEEIHFEEGVEVAEGSPLFTLESEAVRKRLQRLGAELKGASAEAAAAELNYRRRKALERRKALAPERLEESRAAHLAAMARVKELKARILEVRETLEDTRLTSPIAGIAADHAVDAGDYVRVGDRMTTVYETDRLFLSFTVPGRFAGRVERNQRVEVTLPSAPGRTVSGTVVFVNPGIRPSTRDLPVKALVENGDGRLRPGAYGSVTLVVASREDALRVPEEAIVPTRQGYGVFTVEDKTARWRRVEIGLRRPGWVEITAGLRPGDTVVRSGHISLSDGAAVRVRNEG